MADMQARTKTKAGTSPETRETILGSTAEVEDLQYCKNSEKVIIKEHY